MKKTSLSIALLMTISLTTIAQNKINISQGHKSHLLTKTISIVKQNAMGQEMEIKSDVTLDIDIEVKAITPDILFTQTIKRIQLKSEAMGNSMSFDSDKKEDRENQAGQLLSGSLDKPLNFHISSVGKPIENKQDDPAFESAKTMLGDIDELNSELFLTVPTNIKLGDHWFDEQIKDADNKSKIEYTVKSIVDEEAVLSFNGILDKKLNKTMQGIEAIVTANSIISGELTVNYKTGLIKEKKSEINSKGTTEVMGQKIEFTVNKITISSSK